MQIPSACTSLQLLRVCKNVKIARKLIREKWSNFLSLLPIFFLNMRYVYHVWDTIIAAATVPAVDQPRPSK